MGWVKLLVQTLSHPSLSIISEGFSHSTAWKATFYIVLVGIAVAGWFLSKNEKETKTKEDVNELNA